MCGRFSLVRDGTQLLESFPGFVFPDDVPQRYNIAPSLEVAAVVNDGTGTARFVKWGLVPHWANDPKIGNRMINARAETLSEKPAFRDAYRKRRCLVLADGFYEWRKEPGEKRKTPLYIRLKSERAFAFAGLWETWRQPDGKALSTCTIITTEPNALVASIHNRMPVILSPDGYETWLDPEPRDPDDLGRLLLPYPDSEMTAFEVSTRVNSPKSDGPECIQPAEPDQDPGPLTLF